MHNQKLIGLNNNIIKIIKHLIEPYQFDYICKEICISK